MWHHLAAVTDQFFSAYGIALNGREAPTRNTATQQFCQQNKPGDQKPMCNTFYKPPTPYTVHLKRIIFIERE